MSNQGGAFVKRESGLIVPRNVEEGLVVPEHYQHDRPKSRAEKRREARPLWKAARKLEKRNKRAIKRKLNGLL